MLPLTCQPFKNSTHLGVRPYPGVVMMANSIDSDYSACVEKSIALVNVMFYHVHEQVSLLVMQAN